MRTDKVVERIKGLIQASGKSHEEIAAAMGYDKASIVALFVSGVTKVPIARLPALARAVNADPAHLLRMALEQYSPETYEAVAAHLGEILSSGERDIIQAVRTVSHDRDPKLVEAQGTPLVLRFAA